MNNKFLADYLINNFWSSDTKFNAQIYQSQTEVEISNIQLQIDNLSIDIKEKQNNIQNIQQQILDREVQISKLQKFIDEKSWIASLKLQIDKLQSQLDKLTNEIDNLKQSKDPLIQAELEINLSIQKLEKDKSNLEQSLKPEFQATLDVYIQSKKAQIQNILSYNETKTDNYRSKLWMEFESQTKEQYPFEDFKDMPEILDELNTTFTVEKTNFIDSQLKDYILRHSQDILSNFNQIIQNYEASKNLDNSTPNIELKVNYKDLDFIYKSTLSRNKKYFPHLDEIKELTNHPLFKKQWVITLQDIDNYYYNINKKKDVKKFKKFWNTLNTIMLDYNMPLINISDTIASISWKDIETIISDPKKREIYSKYLIFDKDLLIKLQRIINLFNSTKFINFKWFENNIVFINQLINDFIDNHWKYPDSLQENIKDIADKYADELNKLIDNILDLVDKNNLWKDVLQQIMIFQNIIWTIYTYFEETYKSKDINIREILDKILWHLIEKIYMEIFSYNIIDDIEQKNNLLTSYNDIWTIVGHNMEQKDLICKVWSKINIHWKLSSNETKDPRILCLVDILKKLGHFIICKNIYDITQNLFLENEINQWEWKAWADLYTDSLDFKAPSIDPMLISPDKFGIWSWEYMFESYDISDSRNYMAYVRLFNIWDFKNYEKIKSSFCKNWKDFTESENIKKSLEMILYRDEDIMNTTFVFPELTPIIIDKNYEISLDWINSDWLIYIIWEKNYEMLRTYLFYNFMEANREHDSIITTPEDLIWPCKPQPLSDPDSIRIITINPDMPRTICIPRNTWMTKNFEYKRDTIVILNQRCTTWLSWFKEAKEHWKKLYAYAHKINDFPNRNNSIEKIRLDTCDTYEEFLEKLEEFRKNYSSNSDLVVRVETYRSEFQKYEWAKQKVAYRIAQTQNSPSNIIWWEKKKRWRPPKNPQ